MNEFIGLARRRQDINKKIHYFKENWSIFIVLSAILLIVFFTFLILAMVFYPDGVTPGGPVFERYNFWWFFISDLGMYVSWDGNPNLVSKSLLSCALLSMSIGGAFLYCTLYSVLFEKASADRELKFLNKSGLILGIIGSILVNGVYIFPKVTLNTLHEIFAASFFFMLMLSTGAYNLLLIKYDKKYWRYTLVGYVFWVIALIYTFGPILFPQFAYPLTPFKPTLQKFTVLSLCATTINTFFICAKFSKKEEK